MLNGSYNRIFMQSITLLSRININSNHINISSVFLYLCSVRRWHLSSQQHVSHIFFNWTRAIFIVYRPRKILFDHIQRCCHLINFCLFNARVYLCSCLNSLLERICCLPFLQRRIITIDFNKIILLLLLNEPILEKANHVSQAKIFL